jgi:hypothetical protein
LAALPVAAHAAVNEQQMASKRFLTPGPIIKDDATLVRMVTFRGFAYPPVVVFEYQWHYGCAVMVNILRSSFTYIMVLSNGERYPLWAPPEAPQLVCRDNALQLHTPVHEVPR